MKSKRNNEAESIKNLIQEVLQKNKLQQGIDLIAVKETWIEVMGAGVANYTSDIQFKNGILTIKLSSSVLREELGYGKDKIIKLLNKKLNKVFIKNVKLL
jgi:hypothetical protein